MQKCPDCGERVEPEREALHEQGRDARRPDCPRFDVRAFAEARQPPSLLGARW